MRRATEQKNKKQQNFSQISKTLQPKCVDLYCNLSSKYLPRYVSFGNAKCLKFIASLFESSLVKIAQNQQNLIKSDVDDSVEGTEKAM
jgi:hypothetical protein